MKTSRLYTTPFSTYEPRYSFLTIVFMNMLTRSSERIFKPMRCTGMYCMQGQWSLQWLAPSFDNLSY